RHPVCSEPGPPLRVYHVADKSPPAIRIRTGPIEADPSWRDELALLAGQQPHVRLPNRTAFGERQNPARIYRRHGGHLTDQTVEAGRWSTCPSRNRGGARGHRCGNKPAVAGDPANGHHSCSTLRHAYVSPDESAVPCRLPRPTAREVRRRSSFCGPTSHLGGDDEAVQAEWPFSATFVSPNVGSIEARARSADPRALLLQPQRWRPAGTKSLFEMAAANRY